MKLKKDFSILPCRERMCFLALRLRVSLFPCFEKSNTDNEQTSPIPTTREVEVSHDSMISPAESLKGYHKTNGHKKIPINSSKNVVAFRGKSSFVNSFFTSNLCADFLQCFGKWCVCATTLAIAKFGSNATFSSTINALEVANIAPNDAVNQNTSRLPMYAFNNRSSTKANNKAHAGKRSDNIRHKLCAYIRDWVWKL